MLGHSFESFMLGVRGELFAEQSGTSITSFTKNSPRATNF